MAAIVLTTTGDASHLPATSSAAKTLRCLAQGYIRNGLESIAIDLEDLCKGSFVKAP